MTLPGASFFFNEAFVFSFAPGMLKAAFPSPVSREQEIENPEREQRRSDRVGRGNCCRSSTQNYVPVCRLFVEV